MPTPLVGTPTQGGTFPPATTVAVTWPAGSDGNSQLLVVAFSDKASTPGSLAGGWGAPKNVFTHSGATGGEAIYRRKIAASGGDVVGPVSAGGANITFSSAVAADYIGCTIDGDYDSISSWSQQDGTSSVTSPALTSPDPAARRFDFITSANYPGPRVFPTDDTSVTTYHQPGNSGPGLTMGTLAIGSGSQAGKVYVPDDASPSIDTMFDGGTDWTPAAVVSLCYRPITAPPSSGGTQSGVSGTPVIAASATITAPAAPAGGCRWIAVSHNLQNAVVANTPTNAPWVLKDATAVDTYLHRLYVFVQDTPTAVAALSTTITFTGTGTPVVVTASGASTGPFVRLALDKYEFTRDPQSPPVLVDSILGYALTLCATGNYPRTLAPHVDSTFVEILETLSSNVGLAIGKENVGTIGNYRPGLWTPTDPPPPAGSSGDPGDGFRVATMLFGPAGATGGGGGGPADVAITAGGPVVYVAAPGNLRIRAGTLTYSQVTIDWNDLSTDETGFEIKVTNLTTGGTLMPSLAMAPIPHRWWGIRVLANSGDASYAMVVDVALVFEPGAARTHTSPYKYANADYLGVFGNTWYSAFNNDFTPASGTDRWIEHAVSMPYTNGYDFDTPVSVVEARIIGLDTAANALLAVKDFDIVWSDDGDNWTTARAVRNETWSPGQVRTYAIAADGPPVVTPTTVTTTTVGPGVTTATITGLLGLESHEIRVYSVRTGDYSAPAIIQVVPPLPPFQTVLSTGSDLTLSLNEQATVILSTTPAQVGLAVAWSISNPSILAFVGTPGATTNGSGQATAVVKGLGATGPAIVTGKVAGAAPGLLLNGTGVEEGLILTISPSMIEDNDTTVAVVTGSLGGGSLIGRQVFIESSDPTIVADPPSSWVFDVGPNQGMAKITLVGVTEGTVTIQAHTQSQYSNVVSMVVQRPPVPVAYDASGVSMCVITAETPFARARRPNVRRLTNKDLQRRNPGDGGLYFADEVERSEYTFARAALYQQRQ